MLSVSNNHENKSLTWIRIFPIEWKFSVFLDDFDLNFQGQTIQVDNFKSTDWTKALKISHFSSYFPVQMTFFYLFFSPDHLYFKYEFWDLS